VPFTAADAAKHKKGLTPTQAKAWAEIANSATKEYGDERSAIRVANSKATKATTARNYGKEQRKADKSKELAKVPKKTASGKVNPKAVPKGRVVVGKSRVGKKS